MALKFIAISAVSTVLSFVGLQFCTDLSLEKLKSDGLIGWNSIHLDNVDHDIELPLGLYTTIGLLMNCMINVFVLLNLCLKAMFFSELYPSETRKLIERLVNYVIYKGTFLPLVVPPTLYQAGLWSTWLAVLCSLKMFQALARDRLERLNASPSATPWTYLRVYSALLFIFLVDVLWIRLCLEIYSTHGSSMFLLLFFEPLSIAFETLQAILVHGFQLLDIWIHHSACSGSDFRTHKLLDALTAGSLLEWKGILIRNLGFFLDMATFFMALGHYLYIWRLHGMAFHLVDAVLFLNIRALLSAMINRVKGFIRLRIALGALHAALPDATTEELRGYEDECAICREPMAKAKKLNCNHLFHLACLRSWLDQGLTEMYTCPTCRKPLFAGRPENETNSSTGVISSDEQLARQMSAGFDRQNSARHNMPAGLFPNPTLNNAEGVPWRSAGLDSGWLHSWPNQGVDGAGPSTAIRTVGLGSSSASKDRWTPITTPTKTSKNELQKHPSFSPLTEQKRNNMESPMISSLLSLRIEDRDASRKKERAHTKTIKPRLCFCFKPRQVPEFNKEGEGSNRGTKEKSLTPGTRVTSSVVQSKASLSAEILTTYENTSPNIRHGIQHERNY